MSIVINIESTQHKIIIPDDEDMTLGQLKNKIAETLGVAPDDIASMQVTINRVKKIEMTSHNRECTLKGTYNAVGPHPIHVSVRANFSLIQQYKNILPIARQNLISAINTAQNNLAHVIITVGSCFQFQHGQESLLRQQFPIQHLGDIHPNAPVHFIHIDPGYATPVPNVPQLYETQDWELVSNEEGLMKTYAHRFKPYMITTISAPIVDPQECTAYFTENGYSQTLFGVDLLKYQLRAEKNGTGFITGNFYSPDAHPVLKTYPKQDHFDENITPNNF